jgi:hypothetical protein
MKKDYASPFLSGVLVWALVIVTGSCVFSPGPDPVGRLVGRTDCKSSGGSNPGAATAPTSSQECVEYDYDGQSVLRLKHVNAGFNCCPGTVSADIDISGGTIRISEKESSSLCDCSCLYDLSYEIAGLARGTYRISVVGPYQPEGDPSLEFLVDLDQASSGSHCVERTRYPWGY